MAEYGDGDALSNEERAEARALDHLCGGMPRRVDASAM